MESKSMFNNSVDENNGMQLLPQSIEYLREAAKWAKFLSILGFIGIGFLVLGSFFIGAAMSAMYGGLGIPGLSSGAITVFYLVIAVIAFFPVYFMYKFSVDTTNAINANNTEILASGLGYIKSYFKFNGIMAIIALSIYAFIFIIMIITVVAAGVSTL